ncbi:hypothetical protein F4777DRAFT_595516 [Nemania sp. FL0916]|nr:hypothetical protein F4777DRAFT_595516 [Nemania sp. FL0916]
MDAADARRTGAKLLGEVEEESLEELLTSLRANLTTTNPTHHPNTPEIPIPNLSALIQRYQRATQTVPPPLLSITGRYLPFLYHLISTLIAAPHNYTLVIVDAEGTFDVTSLLPSSPTPASKTSFPATPADLAHVHIYRPGRGQEKIQAALSHAEGYMLYAPHESRGRAWWGTVVVGGTGGTVNAGWKGWLRVDRAEGNGPPGFGNQPGGGVVGVREAVGERERRYAVVEGAGWKAEGGGGRYTWAGGKL